MVQEKVQEALVQQLNKELYSAYFYLGMVTYFSNLNLEGFAHYFRVQVQEERDHALGFFNYLLKTNNPIQLPAIAQPPQNFESPLHVFELALRHEEKVTQSIYSLMDVAQEFKDHQTQVFLQWYITEQSEEEDNMTRVYNRLKLAGNEGSGIFMLDNELAQRIYTPAVIPGVTLV
ncbi:ferritin [Desulfitobacterium metallireducens]|uniref:Ferritin n=1 Tax=Desulfitobacterium metallireducens DSM 15288 TaxID=871968 RepID=W0EES9_9FIRM|nr:ferritin [Desulfitobacterium metallireducens]AHF08033.1 ferritin [Desulfitobacterium metallireducens DSM 15288]